VAAFRRKRGHRSGSSLADFEGGPCRTKAADGTLWAGRCEFGGAVSSYMVFSKVWGGEVGDVDGLRIRAKEGSKKSDDGGFLLPMGLHEDAVGRVDVDGLGGTADGLDSTARHRDCGLAQHAVAERTIEVDSRAGGIEDVVAQAGRGSA